ncbi:MAG: hypothetical protein RL339_2486 [Pseudomonadota bacterium]|jgi:pyruvate,water dikinase
MAQQPGPAWIRDFADTGLADLPSVGGKNASLGELASSLGTFLAVPEGFAVVADGYRSFVAQDGLWERLAAILDSVDWQDAALAERAAQELREMVLATPLPDEVAEQAAAAYVGLEQRFGRRVAVAVRSSATAEDLPEASFAGVHESFLNVRGQAALIEAIRQCYASLFSVRAITYRIEQGFVHDAVALSVGVQRMIRADRAASGVIFTLETESGNRDIVMITGVWGLGEAIVQGIADPDEFLVHKPMLRQGHAHVLRRRIGAKQVRLIYSRPGAARPTSWKRVPRKLRSSPCLNDDQILDLARQALLIEQHYSGVHGRDTPMDIEWAEDGPGGKLYIVQARPETVHSARQRQVMQVSRLTGKGRVLLTGQAVGQGIASGRVRQVADTHGLAELKAGEVLVAATTAPDWESAMQRAAAIVTEHGGRTCHAAIVARELGIPAIVGVKGATQLLQEGAAVTVSCAEGEVGQVLEGLVPFETQAVELNPAALPPVEIMVNLGNPDLAFKTAALPVSGVGLARMEFIITEAIRAHPMALRFPERIAAASTRRAIDRLIGNSATGSDYFVAQLAEGIAVIAAAFYPRPVILRTSDFKSNEYAALLGGSDFEQAEANPMIGFRGAARYVHPAYRPAFELECQAIKRVRDELGLTNLIVMIPFCRRIEEAREVLSIMAGQGLERGKNGLQLYIMCEIPSNVVLIDAFAQLFDGFSIGSNDLTQLTLGIDRDSDILSPGFSEQDPAVLALIEQAIAGAHRAGRHCGICGQGPSDRPEFAEWLIARGIDSMSLNPDSVPALLQRLAR